MEKYTLIHCSKMFSFLTQSRLSEGSLLPIVGKTRLISMSLRGFGNRFVCHYPKSLSNLSKFEKHCFSNLVILFLGVSSILWGLFKTLNKKLAKDNSTSKSSLESSSFLPHSWPHRNRKASHCCLWKLYCTACPPHPGSAVFCCPR